MADELSCRERFALTLQHRDVDRPPMDLGATDMTGIEGGARRLAPLLGLAPGGGEETDEAVLRALGIDIRGAGHILAPPSPLARRISATEHADAWGIVYQWNGHHHEMTGHPLAGATIGDLERFPWPDPDLIEAAPGQPRWSDRAGFTVWLCCDVDGRRVLTEPGAIANLIRSEPDTPRRCALARATLAELRKQVEKQVIADYLRPLQAPVGVTPILKCWMELN